MEEVQVDKIVFTCEEISEEIQALRAIYDQNFYTVSDTGKEYKIEITNDDSKNPQSIILEFMYPTDYPVASPPVFKIRCDALSSEEISLLAAQLVKLYNPGEVVMFQWVEFLREYLIEKIDNDVKTSNTAAGDTIATEDKNEDVQEALPKVFHPLSIKESCPVIHHGEPLTDRKSTFQAHAAEVTTVEQVSTVLRELKSNRKIATATHNIVAYRIHDTARHILVQDCDDDGESAAGSRLLHLLQIMDLENVLVVVTRWYGSIHLGPDRFKHINNCARTLLQEQNFGKCLAKETKSKRKGKKK